MRNQKIIIKFFLSLFIVLLILLTFLYESDKENLEIINFQCPEYYPNEFEESEARNEWIDQYQLMNPYASTEDILRARVHFLIVNSCKEILIKYTKYIRSDETAKEDIIQAYIEEFNSASRSD